jgi:hypothetical protein
MDRISHKIDRISHKIDRICPIYFYNKPILPDWHCLPNKLGGGAAAPSAPPARYAHGENPQPQSYLQYNMAFWNLCYLVSKVTSQTDSKESFSTVFVLNSVPQDSILGPLLFLVYCIDIETLISWKNLHGLLRLIQNFIDHLCFQHLLPTFNMILVI